MSQPEYTHYAIELFGSEMSYLDASYRPRSSYLDLAEIALIAAGGFIASAFAASMLPEMVALGAVGAKVVPGMANAIAGGVGGSMLSATMGPDIAGDAKKARLLPIYRNENLRRRAVG